MKKGLVPRSRSRRGFTLIELLVTVSIIGFLSVAGSTSYGIVRAKARDARRVADLRTYRNALELYFEQHGTYPGSVATGLILGSPDAKVISDAGITPLGNGVGTIYLLNAPANPEPYGAPYVYRTLNAQDGACASLCPRYQVSFFLETPTGDFAAGPHLLSDEGIEGPETQEGYRPPSFFAQYMPTPEQVAASVASFSEVASDARDVAARPGVQLANAFVLTPAAALAAIAGLMAGLASAAPVANAGALLSTVFAQPLLWLTRKRRQTWGTVYNASTKVPVDLATVRLIEASTGRAVATKVTDKDGRYAFTAKPGTYRLEVVKPSFAFPSSLPAEVTDDGPYTDVYRGRLLDVDASGSTVTFNIPVDPENPEPEPRQLLSIRNREQLRKTLALAGPVVAAFALAVTPSWPMAAAFALHLFVYVLFRRVAEPPAPKTQGVVYDLDTRKPIDKAIVRIFSLPYHKVLESRMTDPGGRYSFYVGPGMYEMTVIKAEYQKSQTDPIDYTAATKPAFIAADLPMRKENAKR